MRRFSKDINYFDYLLYMYDLTSKLPEKATRIFKVGCGTLMQAL